MTALAPASRAAALGAFAMEVWDRPFVWGRWDCNLFCLAWLDVITGGGGFFDRYVGGYRDEASARAWSRRELQNLRTVLEDAGCELVAGGRSYAQPGDFLLVDDPDEPWYRGHVCAGTHFVSVWPGRHGGFRSYPMRRLPAQALVLRLPCPR